MCVSGGGGGRGLPRPWAKSSERAPVPAHRCPLLAFPVFSHAHLHHTVLPSIAICQFCRWGYIWIRLAHLSLVLLPSPQPALFPEPGATWLGFPGLHGEGRQGHPKYTCHQPPAEFHSRTLALLLGPFQALPVSPEGAPSPSGRLFQRRKLTEPER